jgi:hypothetical protein
VRGEAVEVGSGMEWSEVVVRRRQGGWCGDWPSRDGNDQWPTGFCRVVHTRAQLFANKEIRLNL